MNVYGWIGFWRTILGIGLGAEVRRYYHLARYSMNMATNNIDQYPLSAIIAAEWSSTKSRGKMIAAVFLMQSVGQLAAYAFGLAILHGVANNFNLSPEETDWNIASKAIDVVWRTTIGIGAFPALIALFLRRIIPETPHYLAEKGKIADAVEAVGLVYPLDATLQPADETVVTAPQRSLEEPVTGIKSRPKGKLTSVVEYLRGAKEHLTEKGRWRALLGVMVTWFLLDLAYYGLGLDNPRTISTIFLSSTPPAPYDFSAEGATPDPHTCDGTAVWLADPARPNITIYDMLTQDSIRDMMTISSGALPGSIIILFAIDYLPRTTWMGWMFVVLAGLFAINGGTYFVTYESDQHALTVTLYVLAQAIFNLGPNTMTFMLPAELFATKYRGTFYGLAAASGKLGAIMSLIITIYANPTADSGKFAGLLLGFCPAMLLGAFITWVWIPEVQYPRGHDDKPERNDNASDNGFDGQRTTFRQKLVLPNRPLADIAKDSGDGQILGMRKNLARLFRARDTHHPYESRRRRSISTIHRATSMDQSATSQQGIVLEEADIGDGPEMRYVYTRYS